MDAQSSSQPRLNILPFDRMIYCDCNAEGTRLVHLSTTVCASVSEFAATSVSALVPYIHIRSRFCIDIRTVSSSLSASVTASRSASRSKSMPASVPTSVSTSVSTFVSASVSTSVSTSVSASVSASMAHPCLHPCAYPCAYSCAHP